MKVVGLEFCKWSNNKMKSNKSPNKRLKKFNIQRNNLNTNQKEIYRMGPRLLNIKSSNLNFECRLQNMVILLNLLYLIIILIFIFHEKNHLLRKIQSNKSSKHWMKRSTREINPHLTIIKVICLLLSKVEIWQRCHSIRLIQDWSQSKMVE